MELTPSVPKYISHIKKCATGDIYLFQSNEEHSMNVAKLAPITASVTSSSRIPSSHFFLHFFFSHILSFLFSYNIHYRYSP